MCACMCAWVHVCVGACVCVCVRVGGLRLLCEQMCVDLAVLREGSDYFCLSVGRTGTGLPGPGTLDRSYSIPMPSPLGPTLLGPRAEGDESQMTQVLEATATRGT